MLPTHNKHGWNRYEIQFSESKGKLYDCEFKVLKKPSIMGNFDCKGDLDMFYNGAIEMNDEYNNDKYNGESIIDSWEKNVKSNIKEYFSKKENEILESDIINNEIVSFKKSLLYLLNENGYDLDDVDIMISCSDKNKSFNDCLKSKIYSQETNVALRENNESLDKALKNLSDYCNEINSVLCICESFDNSIGVLRDYGVIESKSLRVNRDFDFMKFVLE